MGKLKLKADTLAQIVISLDGAKVVLDDCKIFAAPDEGDDRIVFQAQDPENPVRMVQVVLTKVVAEDKEKAKEPEPKKG